MKKVSIISKKILMVAIAILVVGVPLLLVCIETNETQAIETDTNPTTEATFYELPIDVDLLDHIQGLCADYVIPVELVLAMIEVESNYKADAVSKAGAIGLMQVIPECHEDRMIKLNCTDLFDPYQNVKVGMDFLSELIEKYDGNLHKALTAYNYGQKGANDKFFGQGTYHTEYSLKVLETTEKIKEGMTEMFFTDDPVKDYDRYAEEQDKQLQKYPQCSMCDTHITDDFLYEINGEVLCEECLNDEYRKNVEEYIE